MANYKSNPHNSFFAFEDDVDDEKFLKNSRVYSKSDHSNTNTYLSSTDSSSHDLKSQLLARKKEIEKQTLESTERSLCLLKESEETGIATAEELQRQREQLERADKNLDTINSALRTTQKKIDSIKSIFGSFKNYLTKKSDAVAAAPKVHAITPIERDTFLNESELNLNSSISEKAHPGK